MSEKKNGLLIKYAKNILVWCENVIDRKLIEILKKKIDAILINHKNICSISAKKFIEYKTFIYRDLCTIPRGGVFFSKNNVTYITMVWYDILHIKQVTKKALLLNQSVFFLFSSWACDVLYIFVHLLHMLHISVWHNAVYCTNKCLNEWMKYKYINKPKLTV